MFVSQSLSATPSGAITVLRVVSFVERTMNAVADWRRRHHTQSVLSNLTDSQLADIGLVRGQISTVVEGLTRR